MAGASDSIDEDRDPFDALGAAVKACIAVDVLDLTDGEVLDAVLGMSEAVGQVEACLAQLAAAFRFRSLHSLDRARSPESWLAARTELSHGRAKALVRIGRQLEACPHVEVAYRAAMVGTAKVELLVAARDGLEELFAEHEEELLAQVVPLTVRQAKILLAHWRAIAEATVGRDDGVDPSTDDTTNTLHVSRTFLGRFRLDGDLDVITGQHLAERLDAERDARFRSGAFRADDGLSASQRNAIILADILDGAAADPDFVPTGQDTDRVPTRGGRPWPSITIRWDARHLLGDAAHTVADVMHRRCVLGDHTALGRSVAERLLCDADVTEVLTYFGIDGVAEPLGVTHHRRRPTPAERGRPGRPRRWLRVPRL